MTDLREAIARELVDLDDLLSLIDDAISESLDMDWQTMWGAKAVVGALEHQGWVVLPASALTAALGREEALAEALKYARAELWEALHSDMTEKQFEKQFGEIDAALANYRKGTGHEG